MRQFMAVLKQPNHALGECLRPYRDQQQTLYPEQQMLEVSQCRTQQFAMNKDIFDIQLWWPMRHDRK